MKHPIQPLEIDSTGIVRFKPNKIVELLLADSSLDLNTLFTIPFDNNDREQLAQLIGYSISGF